MDDIFEATGHTDNTTDVLSVCEAEPDLKLTMVYMWDELSPVDRATIAREMRIHPGELALTKISTVLTSLLYTRTRAHEEYTQPYVGTITGSNSLYINPGSCVVTLPMTAITTSSAGPINAQNTNVTLLQTVAEIVTSCWNRFGK